MSKTKPNMENTTPDNSRTKKHFVYHDGLAYEPMGMPTKRVLRLHEEHQRNQQPTQKIKRHRDVPFFASQNTNIPVNSHEISSSDKAFYSRRRMVEEQLVARDIRDKNVLRAMRSIPRHLFVSEALQATAYDDRPLPIASGQTISQPYVVALMCQLLLAEQGMRVLEVGTGSGYQAAVLHEMGLQVFSVERLATLYENTTPLLKDKLEYRNMTLSLSDGTLGWKRYAPYDRIIVAAGGNKVPEDLKEQLVDGGIMVIPIGAERQKQRIVRVFKMNGKCIEEDCGAVSFVDLIGSKGW